VRANFLADFAGDTAGATVLPDKGAAFPRVAQNTHVAFIRRYFDKVFGANGKAFSARGTFFPRNYGNAICHFYRPKRTGVLAAPKANTAIRARFVPAGSKLRR